jgi:hypothetical protein
MNFKDTNLIFCSFYFAKQNKTHFVLYKNQIAPNELHENKIP